MTEYPKNYEFFYEGSPYSLEPTYGDFIGYRIPASELGAPTSIQTANQVQEVTNLLNQGIKTIELQPISPEVFDQIPKQHFKEIARLQKLTGSETSVHAPMVEPSGFTREGWSEEDRLSAERHLKQVVEKSHEIDNKGNIPVTVHASGIPGAEFAPLKEGIETTRMIAINQDTKQLIPIQKEERIYLGEKKLEVHKPEEELEILNRSDWRQNLSQLAFYKQRGTEILKDYFPVIAPKWNEIITEKIKPEDLEPQQQAAYHQVYTALNFMKNSEMVLNSLYNKAYKYSNEQDRGELIKAANEYIKKAGKEVELKNVSIASGAMDEFIEKLAKVQPDIYIPVEQFALDKASQTIGSAAFHGYDKYGSKAPIVSVENLYPGMAFSRAEQMKKLVDEAREKFTQEAVKKGYGKAQAMDMAKKLIGVTWDVGHLNMMRKEGFKAEDIEKETEKIAKYVKHVHLTDNFGFSDSHLPPGMGNVPVKEILEKLEKKGFEGKKIIEAGGFVQHFKVSPHPYVLEAFGSPIYPMMMQPYWNQLRMAYGSYFTGYGPILPEQHFSMYGSGFSSLPIELGGQIPGKQRMTETPME